jgi:uncharacterized protein YbcC (UPF0753/DUF2309 family)
MHESDRDALTPQAEVLRTAPSARLSAGGAATDSQHEPVATDPLIDAACEQACASIAPSWPLDRSIAVNPHWARIARPVREVAARMAVLGAMRVFPSRAYLRSAWTSGRISRADLRQAIDELQIARQARAIDRHRPSEPAAGIAHAMSGSMPDPEACIHALADEPMLPRLPLLIDVLDDDPRRDERLSWRQAITHQVSQTCAAYFDHHQADWQPERGEDLYSFWRDTLTHDLGIGLLMGLPELHRGLAALPRTREAAERWVIGRLGLAQTCWADYLEAVLLSINGWASWCAWLGWEAGQSGRPDRRLRDLLAIRLAWGAILLECKNDASAQRAFAALRGAWQQSREAIQQAEQILRIDEIWQRALEIGYQRELSVRLAVLPQPGTLSRLDGPVEVQAAFCIDVRSEPIRRALEAVWPAVSTIGFAGFFGLPIAYTPIGTAARRPQLPGLLAPAMEVSEQVDRHGPSDASPQLAAEAFATLARLRQRHLGRARQWGQASRWPTASFAFVEAAGAAYLGKLAGWLWPRRGARDREDLTGMPTRWRRLCRPALLDLSLDARAGLAEKVLCAMGLDRDLAPLVLLVGHGSQTCNNAQAGALDCGACCGQTGEVNARVLAGLLNDPAVRSALGGRGLPIPDATVFVAALHNTTTDEIEIFDRERVPQAASARLERTLAAFTQAGDQVRRERSPRLGENPRLPARRLLEQLRRRAADGAETRPEWGLAGNAAFIIAPRSRSRGAVLDGRVFLHDYDASRDQDGSLLEVLMTAPMLVTHWINWQYHASTCEPRRLGSGNKVLHNVVGGHIGVFEGNGGDLRIGLALQSVHDGDHWMHEPLRLTVIIDAPQASIEAVIVRHPVVRRLVEHGWLHLWRWEGSRLQQRVGGGWQIRVEGGQ